MTKKTIDDYRFELNMYLRKAGVEEPSDFIEKYENETPKGEFVMVIQGKSHEEIREEEKSDYLAMTIEEHMNLYLEKGIDKKESMKLVAKDRGVSKRDIYNALINTEE